MKLISIALFFLVFLLGVIAIQKERSSKNLEKKPKWLREKMTLEQFFFRANITVIALTFVLQIWDQRNTVAKEQLKENENRKEEKAKAKNDSLRQAAIIKNFGNSLGKADTTLDRLQPILKDSKIQLALQRENIDSAKRILTKNDFLLKQEKAIYKKIDLLLNPLSPLNMVIIFKVPFRSGYTIELESSLYKIKEKKPVSHHINYGIDTIVITNIDSLKLLRTASKEDYDNFIKSIIIVTKLPVKTFRTGFPTSGIKGTVFTTGITPEFDWFMSQAAEYSPYRRVIKGLVVDFKNQEFIFQVSFYDLKAGDGSGNYSSNDLAFNDLSGSNFLIATSSTTRERVIEYELIGLSSSHGNQKGYFLNFKSAKTVDIDGKIFYYHHIVNKDKELPNNDFDVTDF